MVVGSRGTTIFLAATLGLGCRANPREPGEEQLAAAVAPSDAPGWAPARVQVGAGEDPGAAPNIAIEVPSPRFAHGTGPRVAIDAGHLNYRIRDNFAPFAEALGDDGFVVEFSQTAFSTESLADVELLVVVNALHPSNEGNWSLPTPSAFSDAEIEAVGAWVEAGGGLWLVADHHPFPGAAAALAERFGFTLVNGFAFREPRPGEVERGLIGFDRRDHTVIGGHPITDGERPHERIERLLSFTGEAFEPPADAQPLFVMPADGVMLLPTTAWEFDASTAREPAGGWAVAAVREQGRGKVAMFGEAAMLSARYVDNQGAWFGVGFVHPDARDNLQLVLNTARWLTD